MTGVYPWRLGLQRGAIERFQATGLDPNRVLLPELLHKGGYSTHLVNRCQIILLDKGLSLSVSHELTY